MLEYDANDPFYNLQGQRQASVNRLPNRNKKKEEHAKAQRNEDNKVKKISTVVTIWGNTRDQKGLGNDAGNEKPKGPNKFLKAAKREQLKEQLREAAVISSVKFGRGICTCSSLDAKCAVHDN